MKTKSKDRDYMKNLKAAALQGDSRSQNELGVRYLAGAGVKKNGRRGVELLRSSALQGNVFAAGNLALFLSKHCCSDCQKKYSITQSDGQKN